MIPNLFQYYRVSAYFLNNIGEVFCQICFITVIALVFLQITPYDISKNPKVGIFTKVMIFIRDSLVFGIGNKGIKKSLRIFPVARCQRRHHGRPGQSRQFV